MRTLKIIGFVAACSAPLTLLVVVSLLEQSTATEVETPRAALPELEPDGPIHAADSQPKFNYATPKLGPTSHESRLRWVYSGEGEVIDSDDLRPRRTFLPAGENGGEPDNSPTFRHATRGSGDLSYNPELRGMGLHIGKDGVPHYGTPENPGTEAGWEVLKRKQQGENTGGD